MTQIQVLEHGILEAVFCQCIAQCPQHLADISTQIRLWNIDAIGYPLRNDTCIVEEVPLVQHTAFRVAVHGCQVVFHVGIRLFVRAVVTRGRYRLFHLQRRYHPVASDDIVQLGVTAGYLDGYGFIRPGCDDFGTVAIHTVICDQHRRPIAPHLGDGCQPVQMLVERCVGRIAELQRDVVGVFSIFSEQRVLPLHRYTEILWQYGMGAVDNQFSHSFI